MPIKRYKFQCWNCPKLYFQSIDITDQQEIIVSCPYCKAEAIVNLHPYHTKVKTVLRRDAESELSDDIDISAQLPAILPTRMPGDPTVDAPPPEDKKKKKRK